MSNYLKSGLGFQLRYQTTNEAPDVVYRMGELGECGGTFTFPFGMVASPLYPNTYPDDVDCIYTIIQPNGTIILMNFLNLDIGPEYSSDQCPDYLEIRDGSSIAPLLIEKICGKDIPDPILSNNNQVWIR